MPSLPFRKRTVGPDSNAPAKPRCDEPIEDSRQKCCSYRGRSS